MSFHSHTPFAPIKAFTDLTINTAGFSVTSQYPDIDSVFINAGVQQATDFTSPETVDLTAFHQQMHVNYVAAVSLVHAFLPFLSGKTTPTSLIL